jgi:DNA/RNA-binding domain of Phe-tRNA-synthetase-like protein
VTFSVSDAWRSSYPEAAVGILAMHNVLNPKRHPMLDKRKDELENQLRSRYAGWDRAALKAHPIIQAYDVYYSRFKKTYHVLLQLESVAFEGKSIPRTAALVEAMFMAELKNLLLTAGHDMEALQMPVRIDVAAGDEQYVRLDGEKQRVKQGDMVIVDGGGIISSVIYGPDRRTRITPDTQHVLFTVYAVPGIEQPAVYEHLEDIQANVSVIAPEAKTELLEVYGAQ